MQEWVGGQAKGDSAARGGRTSGEWGPHLLEQTTNAMQEMTEGSNYFLDKVNGVNAEWVGWMTQQVRG